MTPLPKRTLEWMLKVKYSYKYSYNFLIKQVKKRNQNVSRAKKFLYL